MVELAFVLILLVTLLAGVVSAAVGYGRHNSIQNAAREASRFGATFPGAADTTWLQTVRNVARAAASGDLDAGVLGQVICVAYIDEAGNVQSLTDTGGVETEPDTECFTDDRPGEAKVQIYVERETDFQAIVFSTDLTISADAAARYER
jgi:Flp pilus assembly protein TadG